MRRLLARFAVTALLATTFPSSAHADWLIMPFIGGAFAGQTVLLDLEQGAGKTRMLFGGAGGWLSAGVLGVEADVAYAPRYFESAARGGLVHGSYLLTMSGNVVMAVPLSVTRESLRPYLTGGLGYIDANMEEIANIFPEFFARDELRSVAFNAGGGAIGFLTRRTGLRFDIRQFRSLERGEAPLTGERGPKLSFWRATVGVVLRR